jgi:hypothetical protein
VGLLVWSNREHITGFYQTEVKWEHGDAEKKKDTVPLFGIGEDDAHTLLDAVANFNADMNIDADGGDGPTAFEVTLDTGDYNAFTQLFASDPWVLYFRLLLPGLRCTLVILSLHHLKHRLFSFTTSKRLTSLLG